MDTHTHTGWNTHTTHSVVKEEANQSQAARQARVGRSCGDVRSSENDWLWGNVCLLEKRWPGQS